MSDSKGAAIDQIVEIKIKKPTKGWNNPDRFETLPVEIISLRGEEAKQAILALLAQEVKRARIDELKRLNLYYLQHDSEGEHKLAEQFDIRIKDLERLG